MGGRYKRGQRLTSFALLKQQIRHWVNGYLFEYNASTDLMTARMSVWNPANLSRTSDLSIVACQSDRPILVKIYEEEGPNGSVIDSFTFFTWWHIIVVANGNEVNYFITIVWFQVNFVSRRKKKSDLMHRLTRDMDKPPIFSGQIHRRKSCIEAIAFYPQKALCFRLFPILQ